MYGSMMPNLCWLQVCQICRVRKVFNLGSFVCLSCHMRKSKNEFVSASNHPITIYSCSVRPHIGILPDPWSKEIPFILSKQSLKLLCFRFSSFLFFCYLQAYFLFLLSFFNIHFLYAIFLFISFSLFHI